jgi:cyclopropane fatty-acyl-phospholipid synthase-like methyltransferase
MTTMTTPSWDAAYNAAEPPPWDTGRPQPAFVRLAEKGLLAGELLDCGCGTGEQTLLALAHGADAMGIDVSTQAVSQARAKAAERGVPARFEVADALDLATLGRTFDTVIDSGVFHVFSDEDRARYVASLASVLRAGGHCYLICFSDRQPGTFGPHRISQDDLRAAFSDGWAIAGIEAAHFELRLSSFGLPVAQAWLASLQRSKARRVQG